MLPPLGALLSRSRPVSAQARRARVSLGSMTSSMKPSLAAMVGAQMLGRVLAGELGARGVGVVGSGDLAA